MELVELGTILHMEKGKKPKAQSKEAVDGYLPYVDIKAFEQGIIDNYATTEKSLLCDDGDLLIVCDGSRSGLTGCAIRGVVGSTLSKIYADGMSTEYLRYFIQSKYILLNTQKKGTGTPHLNANILKASRLVVPSLPEQERIVARIEELFSELDKAVETLQKTKQQLAVYRQAVLKEAFGTVQGETHKVRELCEDIKVGIVIKPTQYYVQSGGVPAFRNANVWRGYIENNEWVMISKDGHKSNMRSEVHTNDILISRSGANLGMAAVVPAQFNGYNAIDVVIAVPDMDKINPFFLAHYTNSPLGKTNVKEKEHGGAQGHLNVTAYGQLPITVPTLQEQKKIIEEIDSRLSVCDSIEQTVDTALAQAEALRQSILKEAFEGRLV